MSVSQTDSTVTVSIGSSEVKILRYGATVLSWTIDGKEQLWLSESAKLDGTKAVRGGIPLVFPVFGKATEGPTAALPQHGFARTSTWEYLGQTSEKPVAAIQFGLGPENLSEEAKKQWDYNFTLIYTVTIDDTNKTLETRMSVENAEQSKDFDFNILFHTYLRVPEIANVEVTGLQAVPVHDKVTVSKYVEQAAKVTVSGEVDRVYENVPGTVSIDVDNKPYLSVTRDNVNDVVVWNPWTEKAEGLADFTPKQGFHHMICIEAGDVSKWQKLAAGAKWEGGQTIKAHL
ncbi:Glucose-6-phosphate 1-epimerase [Yarrowia sp. C11]|nr:Glucose-6-phosphate 1-epimerase [Yarrowia sp. E02]KAG5369362.1 Glucose-6-phosphate 1-epimerase [Yarrowia sp. C11]